MTKQTNKEGKQWYNRDKVGSNQPGIVHKTDKKNGISIGSIYLLKILSCKD